MVFNWYGFNVCHQHVHLALERKACPVVNVKRSTTGGRFPAVAFGYGGQASFSLAANYLLHWMLLEKFPDNFIGIELLTGFTN